MIVETDTLTDLKNFHRRDAECAEKNVAFVNNELALSTRNGHSETVKKPLPLSIDKNVICIA